MVKKRLTPIARKLQRAQTDAEKRLWFYIRNRQLEGAKFIRQEQIGPHLADFACRAAHLAIELDGGQHNETVDASRTMVIESFGYRVIRFWNHDVLANTDGVLEAIRQQLLLGFNRSD